MYVHCPLFSPLVLHRTSNVGARLLTLNSSALVFYQNFIFNQLAARGVLHATTYWTAHNIADGLNSLVLCAEMFLIALFQAIYAFNYREYRLEIPTGDSTPFWSSFAHSQKSVLSFQSKSSILINYFLVTRIS